MWKSRDNVSEKKREEERKKKEYVLQYLWRNDFNRPWTTDVTNNRNFSSNTYITEALTHDDERANDILFIAFYALFLICHFQG